MYIFYHVQGALSVIIPKIMRAMPKRMPEKKANLKGSDLYIICFVVRRNIRIIYQILIILEFL